MNITDGELLRQYGSRDERSESAFAELVQRHINLVYSAALRQVNGNTQLAEEVAQSVFTELAKKAGQLTRHPTLTGWLYTSTRYIAANIRRTEQRRALRESEAHAMNAIDLTPEPEWTVIRPLLDEAMHTLDDADREAVLLRHFERRSFAEIGEQLGLAENAARMRVSRALEKLQEALRQRGITSTALALAGILTANGVGAAPAQLAVRIAQSVTAATAAGGLSAMMAWLWTGAKLQIAAAAVTVIVAVALIGNAHTRKANASAGATAAATVAKNSMSNSMGAVATTATNGMGTGLAAANIAMDTNGVALHLKIVAADSGQPIPRVPLDYRFLVAGKYKVGQVVSSRLGICDVYYPSNITEFELTTREEDFADTCLLWRPANGDKIPTDYLLKLERGVPIGGRVLDMEGQPIAGATVGWNHNDNLVALTLPQNHEFKWIETKTDKEGRWKITRIAADMLFRIYGSARESNHVGSQLLFVGANRGLEEQLREETYVIKLGNAVTIRGFVTDETGRPVENAKVFVGGIADSSTRRSKTLNDGQFTIGGCAPKKSTITAEAKGFAATTMAIDPGANTEPVKLVLTRGKILHLRVVDKGGQPVVKAQIYYDPFGNAFRMDRRSSEVPVIAQAEFQPKTDVDGRATWSNAPAGPLAFNVNAAGFTEINNFIASNNDEEQLITLSRAAAVHGNVTDEATGNALPHFRMVIGWPEIDFFGHQTNAHWSDIGRFWLPFANGTYKHTFEEPPVVGGKNEGYFIKFMAEGYVTSAPQLIAPDAGEVLLNVTLRRAVELNVLVSKPDGSPAAGAEIGLVAKMAHLTLNGDRLISGLVNTGGSVLRAGKDGAFKLPADGELIRIVAVTPEGYAEATPEALATDPNLHLQPWGRLEGTVLMGGKPVVGREYVAELGNGSLETISFRLDHAKVMTDEQGKFSLPTLPPGQHRLSRLQRTVGGPEGSYSWGHDGTPFEIRAGETTQLNLGISNYVVIGQVAWPTGVLRPDGLQSVVALTPVAPINDGVNNAAAKRGSSVQSKIGSDDSFTLEEAPPGNYFLIVACFLPTTNLAAKGAVSKPYPPAFQASAKVPVTIPSEPPFGKMDLGTITLQAGGDALKQ